MTPFRLPTKNFFCITTSKAMRQNSFIQSLIFSCFVFGSCIGQTKNQNQKLSADFDQSPPIYYGIPDKIYSEDTSPVWSLDGQQIHLTGIVFEADGKTPAVNVLIYYYQTNLEGRYVHMAEQVRSMPPNALGQTHGYIRGWVKSDANGKYTINTVKPGRYPNGNEVAHIHAYVIDPVVEEPYYIDDFVFDDDRLLTSARRSQLENRGGSGVLRFVEKNNINVGERNIILGLNIPNYPVNHSTADESGKRIGEDIHSFTPFHVWGPDKGTKTCPMCKYGWYHGVLYFVGNNPNWDEIKLWLSYLEKESVKREKYLKAYFIYGNEINFNKSKVEMKLASVGKELHLEKTALTFVPSFKDEGSKIHLNKINSAVENNIILYKRSLVIDNFINLKPTAENFNLLSNRLDETINEFFDLPPRNQTARE